MSKLYSAPVEVPAYEMRSGNVIDEVKHAFYREVCLRLEQTKPAFALRYEFHDAKQAADFQRYVAQTARKHKGCSSVRTSRRRGEQNGVWYVYFARGPNWKG